MAARWWPYRLGPRGVHAVERYCERLAGTEVALDTGALTATLDALDAAMVAHVAEIVGRDGLPHHAHLLNGWGDALLPDGTRLRHGLTAFVHRGTGDVPVVFQKHPEGEVHPWQSFAYALMAGVDPDAPLDSSGLTLRHLTRGSRWLNTTEGEELGHLLYVLARLDDAADPPFVLADGSSVDLDGLVAMAVQAHMGGHFDVCRKAHLTEGLCAAAATFDTLDPVRPLAEAFLAGQVDGLALLGAALAELGGGRDGAGIDTELVVELRAALAIDSHAENHFYWAGHVMELAGLAVLDGYELSELQWRVLIDVANHLDALAPTVVPHTWFPGCFLHFGHYRRGVTLLAARCAAVAEGRPFSTGDLAAYTADLTVGPRDRGPAPDPPLGPLLQVAPPDPGPTPEFSALLAAYRARARPGLAARGGYPHFRRVIPDGWPRSVHYELLVDDEGHHRGELHFESDVVAPLARAIASLVAADALPSDAPPVRWDPDWYGGRGRLTLLGAHHPTPEALADEFVMLVDATLPLLDEAARALHTPTVPWEYEG